jgi:geranylgeranyl pyrophosphate synthase
MESNAEAACKNEMLQLAIMGHRELSIGQGAELCWTRNPQPLKATQVVDIFRQKTAPAFATALRIGAAYSGASKEMHDILREYSEALGIAYQINDDLQDIEGEASDIQAIRPSFITSIAYEKASTKDKEFLQTLWQNPSTISENLDTLKEIIHKTDAQNKTEQILEAYKEQATNALRKLNNPTLKGLLRRVIGKIFNDLEIKGWCNELASKNAANSETSNSGTTGS